VDGPDAGEPTIADPVALLHHLDASGHFHRDSRFGRLFHRGMVSLRENVPTDSLHVSVDGNRLAAHVDRVSPLVARSDGESGYSVRRAAAHNLAGMTQDLVSLLRGRQGDHSCALDCEWISGEAQSKQASTSLLDPADSAWSVQLEARVAGRLDERRLRAALAGVLGYGCEPVPLDVVACDGEGDLDAARSRLQRMAVPVTQHPPLHVYLARHSAGDVLMLNLNHAAGDGLGALQVLKSIARAYAADDDRQAPLDFLALHDLPVRPVPASAPMLVRHSKKAVERLQDALAQPMGLAAEQPDDSSGYGFHRVALTVEETRRVIDAGRSVLMAALHLAIGDWNLQHGAPGRRVGVLAPADLRPSQWRDETIGNFSVTARVSTSRRHRSGPAVALRAIAAQTARNKRTRAGVALIAALQRSGMLALWAKQSTVVLQPITGNHQVDTAMLCNLGWVGEAPSFGPQAGETTELWFSLPVRSPLAVCIGAVTAGERLQLTLRYPHRLFGPAAAGRFADCYADHVRLVAGRGA